MTERNSKKFNDEWTREEAESTYRINRWGDGFFGVNSKGKLCVYPERREEGNGEGPCIVINEVIEEMKNQNLQLPAVIRFHDILRTQVASLNHSFQKIIEEAEYKGQYRGVFPIKVNQMREVVEEIVDIGEEYNYGLEACSKAELLSVLAFNENPNALTVLNGYKDEEYMRLAMLARKLGRQAIVVVEKFNELPLLVKIAREMKVEPLIGLRAKLATQGKGKWVTSSGDRAKFGLTVAEILQAFEYLKKEGMESSLRLFHFHVGSQVIDIRTIKDALTEGARMFTKLVKLGAPLEYFDVGGGLAVDYDGSRSAHFSSMNYNLSDYVSDVIYIMKQVCDLEGVEHPHIVSESGRAITASHSCVVTNVFDKIEVGSQDFPTDEKQGEHILVKNMRGLFQELSSEYLLETYNDAYQYRNECLNAFKLGVLDLEERAKVETLYWQILRKIRELSMDIDEEELSEDILNLDQKLVTQYLCNFSVFQSLPDSWAIGQILPIVPLTKLNQVPDKLCVLADITCDSDGKIDKFITDRENPHTLPLHSFDKDEEYNLGIFLTGAYQDVMGDNHNLFGRVNEVHVYCHDDDPQDFYIEEVIRGVDCQSILSIMQYSSSLMAKSLKKSFDRQVKKGRINPREGRKLVEFYEGCLKNYTYLDHDS